MTEPKGSALERPTFTRGMQSMVHKFKPNLGNECYWCGTAKEEHPDG